MPHRERLYLILPGDLWKKGVYEFLYCGVLSGSSTEFQPIIAVIVIAVVQVVPQILFVWRNTEVL